MATKPKIVTLTNSSVDVLNAIRNNATNNYRDYVPVATADADSIREIGAIIMDHPQLQNEFLSALVNRIGRVILSSKLYQNPWAMFKKGMLEFGETVEDIFVDLAKPFQFDPAYAENTVFKREKPNVRSAFYVLNYQKFYKSTIQNTQLKQAFLSWDGITELIAKITEAMYTAANYDEFEVMKYMLAKNILNGRLYPADLSSANTTAEEISIVKGVSNKLTFMSTKYNVAGVHNHTLKDDQYVLINSEFEATMNVEVLATAFNMDKAQFMGHVVLVDGFGEIDNSRLAELFADDPTYTALTDAELTALNAIPLVIVDKDYFMIFDNLFNFTEQYNGEGLYWNYWYHTWKTFAVSPYAQAVVFVPTAPSVISVSVTPATATIPETADSDLSFTATVVTAGFAPKEVEWSISDVSSYTGLTATINGAGVLSIRQTGAASGTYPSTITVTATSTYDSTKTASATVTLA